MKIFLLSCMTIVVLSCQSKNKEEGNTTKPAATQAAKPAQKEVNDYGKQVKGHYDKKEDAWISEDPFYDSVYFNGSDFESVRRLVDNEDEPNMGLIDKQGKIVVATKYDGISIGFTNGFCQVGLDHNWGIVDDKGKEILPPVYSDIQAEKDGIFRISKDNKYGFADKIGKILVPPTYESVSYAGEGLFFFMKAPAQWGVKNFKEEVVVQPEFTNTGEFVNGKTVVQKKDGQDYVVYANGNVVKK
ncbi:hypothetical protein IW15_09755 [Chryseobacterium soli]|uniref:WG repeat-containing protein n=1 Tax=Chryseobacterium soli TaxID=445961 RepID=A0A086A8N0_9FLAO|nr:WG repeat-containing protein [Chryseobacterium soli]KFF13044.1 hypothetical protein IW15_09755 [Chryseobacterium soli]